MCGPLFGGSEPTALAVLDPWAHLRSLASARSATLTAVIAEHTRGVADTPARATAIKAAARAWADFWDDHLDLDALAVDVTEHLADLQKSRARVERLTAHARQWWEHLYGDDPLVLSLPGVGPATGACIRAYFGDGSGFDNAKKAANYVGITPTNYARHLTASSAWQEMPWTLAAGGFSNKPAGTADGPGTRCTQPAELSTQARTCSPKNNTRLETLFTADTHVAVEASWGAYQRMVAAYREPDRTKGRELMQAVIDSLSTGVPTALTKLRTLGRTLKRRAQDVLAYFERPGTSNGPTEAINGRLDTYEDPPSASRTSPTT